MLTRLIDRMIEASWRRAKLRRQLKDADTLASSPRGLAIATQDGPPTNRIRQFTVHDAMNGTYIEFMRRKYNPSGPDDYVREIYLVAQDEALVDAISTVLVLMEK